MTNFIGMGCRDYGLLGSRGIFGLRPLVILVMCLSMFLLSAYGQSEENVYSGSVNAAGELLNIYLPWYGVVTPTLATVTIHNNRATSENYAVSWQYDSPSVSETSYWRAEQLFSFGSTVASGANFSYSGTAAQRCTVGAWGTNGMASYRDVVILKRGGIYGVEVDRAYVNMSSSGSVLMTASPWWINDATMEGSSASYPNIDLFDGGLEVLEVKLSVQDKRLGGGSNILLMVGKQKRFLGSTFSAGGDSERRFDVTVSSRQGNPVAGVDVQVFIDGERYRNVKSPAEFVDGKYVMDLGKIVLGEDCDGCTTGLCVAPKVEAGLAAK